MSDERHDVGRACWNFSNRFCQSWRPSDVNSSRVCHVCSFSVSRNRTVTGPVALLNIPETSALIRWNYIITSLSSKIHSSHKTSSHQFVYEYEVYKCLSAVKKITSGPDNTPYWLFKHLAMELTPVVTHIINLTLTSGRPPYLWKRAIVTSDPVPKIPHPTKLYIYIYLYSSKNDSNQTNRKEQKKTKKLDSEHNIENTVTYTPT